MTLYGPHIGGMGLGGLGFGGFGLLFWVLVAIFIYLLVKGKDDKKPTAVDILNKRFAKGEITREDYVRMKKEIIGEK